jgi:WS/DGAT/MGAT family acyltransferase
MMAATEPLSLLDAFFLYLESPATPMHTGSLAVFEGGPLRDRRGVLRMGPIRDGIAERLYLVPKLRRRVRFPVGALAAPVWVDDPDFDVTFHVRHVALPAPGSERELIDLCAELMAVPLDRARPLWEMWFVEGLDGGRVALVEKVHHALADGLASVELATVLLDVERHPVLHHPARPWHPRRPPATATVVVGSAAHRAVCALRAGAAAVGALRDPAASARRGAQLVQALGTFATPATIAPRSALNVPVTQGRRLALVRQPLEPVRLVAHRLGVTINDVVLTAVTGGLRAHLALLGRIEDDASLRALVPVGADHGGDHRLGNEVSALVVPLPVGIDDPVTRLRAVADAVGMRKGHHQALLAQWLLGALEPVPPGLLAPLAPLVHRQRLCNLVVTNVPGPQFPLYALGARMLEVFPLLPLAGNLGIGVAVFSYDGQLTLGIVADRDRVPSLDALVGGIGGCFAALEAVAAPVAAGPGVRRHDAPAPAAVGGRSVRAS